MTSSHVCQRFSILVVGVLFANIGGSAESPRVTPDPSAARSIAQRPSAPRSNVAKGPLPDPTILDGSTQTVEKRSEYGMIGEFEMPGDENVRNGKVGGPQNQAPATAGGQSANPPAGQPQGGGGGGLPAQQTGGGSAGGDPAQQSNTQPAGGGQAGGPENPNAAGNPVGGAGGEPGAQPQGIQVAELGGAPSGQPGAAGPGGVAGKPQPITIGDKAMRIAQAGTPPGTVGATPQIADGHVQQHDKGTGTGGKPPTSPQGPGRVEKGRVIPAGL